MSKTHTSTTFAWFLGGILAWFAGPVLPAVWPQSTPLVSEDQCVVELVLPPGAKVTADGRAYGHKSRLTFNGLEPGRIYTSRMTIGFAEGGEEQRKVLLRGGWHVPLAIRARNLVQPEMMTQTGHAGSITTISLSPDGRYVATGSDDKTVILWDATTGQQFRSFVGHTAKVVQVVFSPSGKEILTSSEGLELVPNDPAGMSGDAAVLWDVASGRKLRTFGPPKAGNYYMAFTLDGSGVLTISGKGVHLWETATGRRLRTVRNDLGYIWSAAVRPDGEQLLTVSGKEYRKAILWDLTSGRQVRVFELESQEGRWGIHSVAFSPDGRRVLAMTGNEAIVWDLTTGQKLCSFSGANSMNAWVAFGPDSNSIVTGDCKGTYGKGALWNAQDGRLIRTFEGGFGMFPVVAFHPHDQHVVVGGVGNLNSWDANTGKKVRDFLAREANWPREVRFTPDGRHLLVCPDDGNAVLWNPAVGRVEQSFAQKWPVSIERAAFSADGQRLLTFDEFRSPVVIWDTATGQPVQTIDTTIAGESPGRAAISPDGNDVLIALREARVVGLWDVTTGRKIRDLAGSFQILEGLAFSHDGRRAAVSSDIKKVSIWDVASGRQIRSMGENVLSNVGTVEFSPDDRKLLVVDISARIFDVATGHELQRFLREENESTTEVAYSPDARYVLIGYSAGTVRLHDAATGTLLQSFLGHTDMVETLAFSPDGRRIVTGSRDSTVRCWSVATGDEIFRLIMVNEGQDWLVDTPEGLFDGSEGGRKKVSFRLGGGLNVVSDTLVLLLSGHGTMVGQRFYFLPHELKPEGDLETAIRGGGLSGDELDDAVSAVPALKRVLIYDTCQSGGAIGAASLARSPFVFHKAQEQMSRAQGSFIVAATAAGDEAQESPQLGHGVLTYTLLARLGAVATGPLKDRPPAQQDVLNVRDWLGFAQDEVPALTKVLFGREQFIKYTGSGTDFAILPATPESRLQVLQLN